MELGDLHMLIVTISDGIHGRNPRYNGIGWFTVVLTSCTAVQEEVAILAIMELGDLQLCGMEFKQTTSSQSSL